MLGKYNNGDDGFFILVCGRGGRRAGGGVLRWRDRRKEGRRETCRSGLVFLFGGWRSSGEHGDARCVAFIPLRLLGVPLYRSSNFDGKREMPHAAIRHVSHLAIQPIDRSIFLSLFAAWRDNFVYCVFCFLVHFCGV